MSIYSTRFALGQTPVATSQDIFTAPYGVVTVVRDISLVCVTPGSNQAAIVLSGVASLVVAGSAVQFGYTHVEGRWVMRSNEVLSCVPLNASSWQYVVSGYLLE